MRKALAEIQKDKFDNASLAIDRYTPVDTSDKKHESEREVLKKLAQIKPSVAYSSRYDRWRKLVATLPDMLILDFALATPMAVGLGNQTVFENGLSFNRIYGMPQIPGSSLKGLLRRAAADLMGLEIHDEDWNPGDDEAAWKERFGDPLPEDMVVWRALFGSAEAMAALTVFDAWMRPVEESKPFMVDVLTPHHGDYYRGKQDLPLDSDMPIPVAFLSVKPATVFTIAIQLPNSDWNDTLIRILTHALGTMGVGAKTNAGYGYFRKRPWEPPKEKDEKAAVAVPKVPAIADGVHEVQVELLGKPKPDRSAPATWDGRRFSVTGFLPGFSAGQGDRVVAKLTVKGGEVIKAVFVGRA